MKTFGKPHAGNLIFPGNLKKNKTNRVIVTQYSDILMAHLQQAIQGVPKVPSQKFSGPQSLESPTGSNKKRNQKKILPD